MDVKTLKKALVDVPDYVEVVFQGNVEGEYDTAGTDEPGHTICAGHCYSAWPRRSGNTLQFVLDLCNHGIGELRCLRHRRALRSGGSKLVSIGTLTFLVPPMKRK